MYGINQTTHLGNLTRDPEVKHTQSGKTVARLSIACNFPFKDKAGEWQQGVDFITYVAWERTAEIVGEYLTKGSKVLVEGRVKPRSYDKEGQTVYVTDLVVTTLRMLDSRTEEESAPAKTDSATPQKAQNKKTKSKKKPPVISAEQDAEIPNEDIPF